MYNFKEIKYKKSLITCLIIFFLVCTITSIYYGNRLLLGSLDTYNNDDVKYLRAAETLIETGELTYNDPETKTVFIMPGIVFTLTPFVYFFGKIGAILAFKIFSAILQTFTLYVLFLLFKKIFDSEKVALVTVILNMLYISNIYVTTLLLSETIVTCLLINLIYICIHAVQQKKIKYYIIGGILWGATILFKPIMLVFPITILILMLLEKYTFKQIIQYSLIPIGIVLMFLTPWWIRNYVVFNQFIPLTLSSGNPKLQGAYINYNRDVNVDFSSLKGLKYSDELASNEIENAKADIVIKHNLENNPLHYIYWITIGKTIENFKTPFLWYDLYGINFVISEIIHIIFLILGGWGIVLGIKTSKNKASFNIITMILSVIIFFNLVHLLYYCFSRYVYPIMPLLIGFASISVLYIIKKIKEKNIEKINHHSSI